ncbi:transient receptor potential cation channel subfamily A member 1 homolog [Lytechinus variegatus]|uniref:transient receptor potential cation channel subfamily A member 1 homolog n=1 Tax=Lytechinus variegatus TaxID=7654 RepID=UPI001BB213AD|nr:transient receptor potential cation channel subfamily A member 1 homolog [Lytechinus variegatus]XP_041481038.1 transient receptor potential cation channel subfamily A member 1 homolog [Lytechinus variegatus]
MYPLTRRTPRRPRSRTVTPLNSSNSSSSSDDDGDIPDDNSSEESIGDLSTGYSTPTQSSTEEERSRERSSRARSSNISSHSEPEVNNRRLSILQKSQGRALLLKLVTSRHPSIEKARSIFKDLSPDEIKEELQIKDKRGNTALHHACLKSLVPLVELILEHSGEDTSKILETEGECGCRPSHLVVRQKARNETQAQSKVKIIELLASKGALFNEKDIHGLTPLHLACNHDESRRQMTVIAALLSLGDVKVDEPVNISGMKSTLLNIACNNNHYETAQLLLENGANPLVEDGTNHTPLFTILTRKNTKFGLQFLKICEKKGHNLNKILSVKNLHGRTALHQAIKIGNLNLVTYCLSCLIPEDETDRGDDNSDYLLDYTGRYGTNLMHTACMKGHLDLAIMFHELCPKFLTMKTTEGMTPLHYTCKNNHSQLTEEVCAMMLSHSTELPLTMDDFKVEDGKHSLLKYSASRGSSQSMIVLLKYVKDRSVIMKFIEWLAVEKNIAQVLKDLLDSFDYISRGHLDDDEIERIVLRCAAAGRTESLHQFVKWRKAAFFYKEEQTENNVMHLIAKGGHLDTAKNMMKNSNVDFKSGNAKGQIPLHLAIKEGHRELTKLFLEVDETFAGVTDARKVTPLMYACKRGDLFQVDLLLEQSQTKIKFFENDMKGLNCLDHAINSGHERVAVRLLEQNDWRSLLARSTDEEGGNKTTPMRKLIEQMPGVAKFVLDKCVTKLSCSRDNSNCNISVDYELLEDWYSSWMRDDMWNRRMMTLDYMASRGYDMILHTFSHGDQNDQAAEQLSSNFQDNGKLKDDARINVTDPIYRAAHHPLRLMLKTEESKELLNHPVVRLMLAHKQEATRLLYWLNFFILITHLILVTAHSLYIPPPFYIQPEGDGGNYTWLADGQRKWVEMLDPVALIVFGKVGIWIILTLTVIYFLLFLYRVWVYRQSTLSSIKGLLSIIREIALQVFTILFILPGFSNHQYFDVNLKAEWQWQLGAFAVSLAWFNFILYLQTMPFLGIYVLMFLEVLSTLMNFILIVGIFIISFAVVFCILLLNQVPFNTFWDSFGKVIGMLSGDMDYGGIFNNLDYLYKPDPSEDFTSLVFYPLSTRIIFYIFIIFMPILIMNLLTALAVYDIEQIQKKAKMYKRTLEVKTVLDVQDNMFLFLWKNSVIKFEVIPVWTRISAWYKLLYKFIGYKETHDLLVSFLERTEDVEFVKTNEMTINDMREEIHDMSKKIMRITENVMDIKTKLNSMKQ